MSHEYLKSTIKNINTDHGVRIFGAKMLISVILANFARKGNFSHEKTSKNDFIDPKSISTYQRVHFDQKSQWQHISLI